MDPIYELNIEVIEDDYVVNGSLESTEDIEQQIGYQLDALGNGDYYVLIITGDDYFKHVEAQAAGPYVVPEEAQRTKAIRREFEIRFLEVHYVPTEIGYDKEEKICYQRTPIGKHSIECKHMPQELQDLSVDFIISQEVTAQEEIAA